MEGSIFYLCTMRSNLGDVDQMNVSLCYDSGEISTHFGSGEGDFRPPSSEAVFEEKVHD